MSGRHWRKDLTEILHLLIHEALPQAKFVEISSGDTNIQTISVGKNNEGWDNGGKKHKDTPERNDNAGG
jgi:hypothetical protein